MNTDDPGFRYDGNRTEHSGSPHISIQIHAVGALIPRCDWVRQAARLARALPSRTRDRCSGPRSLPAGSCKAAAEPLRILCAAIRDVHIQPTAPLSTLQTTPGARDGVDHGDGRLFTPARCSHRFCTSVRSPTQSLKCTFLLSWKRSNALADHRQLPVAVCVAVPRTSSMLLVLKPAACARLRPRF